MSRDSVLYRSPAYIDTNLCPPQAVLCICRIYIYCISLFLFLSPSTFSVSPLPTIPPSFSRNLSLSRPLRGLRSFPSLFLPLFVSLSVSVYSSTTIPFLSLFLSLSVSPSFSQVRRRGFQHAYRSPKFALVFVLRHPRAPPLTPLSPLSPRFPCVLLVRVYGVGEIAHSHARR